MRSTLVSAALAGCVLAAVSGLGTGANAATVSCPGTAGTGDREFAVTTGRTVTCVASGPGNVDNDYAIALGLRLARQERQYRCFMSGASTASCRSPAFRRTFRHLLVHARPRVLQLSSWRSNPEMANWTLIGRCSCCRPEFCGDVGDLERQPVSVARQPVCPGMPARRLRQRAGSARPRAASGSRVAHGDSAGGLGRHPALAQPQGAQRRRLTSGARASSALLILE